MGSNAPEALLCKASGKRSEDFCAEQRRKSNGILQAVGKVLGLFRQPVRGAARVRATRTFKKGPAAPPTRIKTASKEAVARAPLTFISGPAAQPTLKKPAVSVETAGFFTLECYGR